MGNFISQDDDNYISEGRYGFKPEYHDINDKKIRLSKNTNPARDIDLQEYFPKVFDQYNYNTSTAQAVAAVLEYEQLRNKLDIIPISKLYLYILGKGQIRRTFKIANKYGVISEELFPYDSAGPFPDMESISHRDRFYQGSLDYSRVPNDPEIIKLVLTDGIPIIFGFDIYESFEDHSKWNNDGVMPLPSKGEKYLGTQTAVIVGYSKKKKSVIVRNSWGTNWKNNGHFYIPFNYIISKSCSTLWTLQLVVPQEKPPIKKQNPNPTDEYEPEDDSDSDSEQDEQPPVINLKECVIKE